MNVKAEALLPFSKGILYAKYSKSEENPVV